MKISIIGSGNAATVLGRLLKQHNYTIAEIVSRNNINASKLAEELEAASLNNISAIARNSDVYLIAVKDDAIASISKQIDVTDKIVVHTCGSVSMNVLKNSSVNYGVLYPLQSLRKELNYAPVIPLLIDASNEYTKNSINEIAASVSKNIKEANDEQRMQYHLSAVIVSNFTNYLFALTKQYCEANNIEFSLLLPLIDETVKRMHKFNPAEMQTGPAMRNDQSTIQKHLVLLNDFPQLQYIYKMMSESIAESSKNHTQFANKLMADSQ